VAGAGAAGIAGAAVFSAPSDLPGGIGGTGAHLALEPGGVAATAWRSGGGQAQLATRAAGAAFALSPDLFGTADAPVVALDGAGRATVAWILPGSERLVQARAAGDAGPAVTLSAGGADASGAVIAADAQGDVTVAWIRSGIVQARTRPAGATAWDPVADVGPPTAAGLRIAAFDGGGVVLAWTVEGNAASSTRVSLASAWGPVEVHGATAGLVDVATAASGDAALVWTSTAGLRHAHRRGKVVGFDAASTLDPSAAAAFPAVSVAPDGRSTTAWLDAGGRLSVADVPAAGPPGAAVAVAGPFSAPGGAASPPVDVAAGPEGLAAAVWTFSSAAGGAFRDRDGAWGAAADLGAARAGPEVAMDLTGAATGVWEGSTAIRSAAATPAPQATPVPLPTPGPLPTPVPSPAPQAGKSVVVGKVSGTVLVRVPGAKVFTPLAATQTVPLGAEVDATAGRVQVGTAQPSGEVQRADFFEGRFSIRQVSDPKVKGGLLAELTLRAPLQRCKAKKKASAAAKGKKARHLWGDGKGRFRTRGAFSAATVRGTRWRVEDRCDRTITRVARGSVEVRDLTRKRTVVVRAGRSYTARAS
jgi:hypothetical protein